MLAGLPLSWISVSFLLQAAPGSSLTSGSSNDEELLPLSSDFSLLSGNNYEPDLLDIWSADSVNDASPFVSSSSSSSSSTSSLNNVFDFLDDPNQLISSDSNFLDPISSSINNDDESTLVANTFVGSSDDNNDVSCTSSSKVKRKNEQSSCVSSPDNDVIDLRFPNLPQVFGSGGQYGSSNSDFSQEGAALNNFPKFCRVIGFPIGVCCEGPISDLFTLADFLIYDRIQNCDIGMYLNFRFDFFQHHRILCIIVQLLHIIFLRERSSKTDRLIDAYALSSALTDISSCTTRYSACCVSMVCLYDSVIKNSKADDKIIAWLDSWETLRCDIRKCGILTLHFYSSHYNMSTGVSEGLTGQRTECYQSTAIIRS